MMTLPLAIGGICIITSIIGTFFVKLGASQSIMGALYKGPDCDRRAVAVRRGPLLFISWSASVRWRV